MRTIQANHKSIRTHLALAVSAAFVVGGCASGYDAPEMGEEMVWSSDGEEERPGWTMAEEISESDDGTISFVGMSNRHSTQRGARDAAMRDARQQIARHAETEVEDRVAETVEGSARQDEIQNPEVVTEQVTTELAELAVQRMEQEELRYEQWGNPSDGDTFYKAFVLTTIDGEQLDVEEEAESLIEGEIVESESD